MAGQGGLSLGDAAEALGVAKSTAFNLLKTLVAHGYLREERPGPRYLLGMSLMRLGDLVGQHLPVAEMSRALLRELTAATGLTSRVAVVDDGCPVFLERVDGPGMVRFHTPLGFREAPHASAAGKAILATYDDARVRAICEAEGLVPHTRSTIDTVDGLLADLEQTRARGFAVDDEEAAEGVFCVGAAFSDHQGRCLGALSVTGIRAEAPPSRLLQIGQLVREHADRLTKDMGGHLNEVPASLDTRPRRGERG
jgi:IclR family acetate operon transcriptional repressor